MITQFDEVYGSLMKIIEVLGTFTFVVSVDVYDMRCLCTVFRTHLLTLS